MRKGPFIVAVLVAAVLSSIVALIMLGGLGGPMARAARSPAVLLMLAGMLVIVGATAGWASVRRKGRRRRSPGEVAEELGLSYTAKGARSDLESFGPLPGIPQRGQISHVFRGELGGRTIVTYAHALMVHTGYASIPIQHTVALCAAPPWPLLSISPRTALGRSLRRLGFQGGLQMDRADFNRVFRVRGDDDFAIALLSPELQEFMLENPGITWHVQPGVVAMISGGAMRFDGLASTLELWRRFWAITPDELEAW